MSKTLSIATVNDAVTEGDGSVTVTIQSGDGYTIRHGRECNREHSRQRRETTC